MSFVVYSQENIDSISEDKRVFVQELLRDCELCQEQAPKDSCVVMVDPKNFEAEVLQSCKPVVIDIYGVWCGPCNIFRPIYEKVAVDFVGQVKFVAIDYDTYAELIEQYKIESVPHLMFFHKGSCVAQVPGVQLCQNLSAMMQRFVQLAGQEDTK